MKIRQKKFLSKEMRMGRINRGTTVVNAEGEVRRK
jgi:hypothetical protein